MATRTAMVCTSRPACSGGTVTLIADQAALASALSWVTVTVQDPPPNPCGTYTNPSGANNDYAYVYVSSADFTSLCSQLHAGSVEVIVTHTGGTAHDQTVSKFEHYQFTTLSQVAATVNAIEAQVQTLQPAELREDVKGIRVQITALATEVVGIQGTLEQLLRRLPSPDSEPPAAMPPAKEEKRRNT